MILIAPFFDNVWKRLKTKNADILRDPFVLFTIDSREKKNFMVEKDILLQ
jgi:hypothetical protein